MTIPRVLPAVLGVISILPTAGMLAIHSILARSREDRAPAVRTTAIIAAILEATVLAGVTSLTCTHIGPWSGRYLRRFGGLWFGTGLFLCAVAAAVSVSNLICLSRVSSDASSTILGSNVNSFLVGAAVVLGLAFATQLVFLVFHFVVTRMLGPQIQVSHHTEEAHNRPPPRIKSIAYHDTNSPISEKARGLMSFESRTPPGSSSGETFNSIRSSLSSVVRPISSKTRLLSQRISRRPTSLDLPSYVEPRTRTTEEGFDSWDTSAVDPQNRQTVLESSSPPAGRFLETIPASPTTSRSPSPGTPLDLLEPPRSRRRSRSYSPAPNRANQSQRAAFTQHSTQSEEHIHPLFRSDSPNPPPIATPGTVVIAAPNGGQILSDRQSIRSLRRMRSGSLPLVPSPLQQGSSESFHRRGESNSPEIREEAEEEEHESLTLRAVTPTVETERKMTPPIPDWILSAGSRTSLTTYTTRKVSGTRAE